jgi:hypothetical protein
MLTVSKATYWSFSTLQEHHHLALNLPFELVLLELLDKTRRCHPIAESGQLTEYKDNDSLTASPAQNFDCELRVRTRGVKFVYPNIWNRGTGRAELRQSIST